MNILNLRAFVGAVLMLGIALAGCGGKSVEIVRFPGLSPVVIPAPEIFHMTVAVKNYSESNTSDELWLRVSSEYWPPTNSAPIRSSCVHKENLHVGVLAPGQSWALTDYRIDKGSECSCVKNSCTGHVSLSLHVDPNYGPHIDGPNTGLHVTWSASGDLADMTISEF
jgi:hypothetical protein